MTTPHQTQIRHQSHAGRSGKQTFRAVCSCGWRGEGGLTKRQAERQATDHTTTKNGAEMTAAQTALDLYPRNGSGHWIRGSRDRYGYAYFITERDGQWGLWRNQMPFSPNARVATFDHQPSLEEVEEVIL